MPLDLRLLKYFPDFLVNSFGENNQRGTMMCRCNLEIFTNQETFQWPEVLSPVCQGLVTQCDYDLYGGSILS